MQCIVKILGTRCPKNATNGLYCDEHQIVRGPGPEYEEASGLRYDSKDPGVRYTELPVPEKKLD